MKRFFIIVIVVVVIGGVFAFRFVQREEESPYVLVAVERGTLVERVLATGMVEPSAEFSLAFVSGGRVASVAVEVGDQVDAGDELARLEAALLSASVRQAEAARATAQANLDKTIAGASAADIAVAESSVNSAQVALDNAKRSADDKLAEAYNDTLDVFQDVRLNAEAALQALNNFFSITCNYQCWKSFGVFTSSLAAKAEAERQKPLADDALVRIQVSVASMMIADYDAIDAAFATLRADVTIIRSAMDATYDALQEDVDKTTVQTARTNLNASLTSFNAQEQTIISAKSTNTTDVNNAQAALDTTKAQLALKKEPAREVDLAALRAQVAQARANLDTARVNLADAVLKAPATGTVTAVGVRVGEIAFSTTVAIGLLVDDSLSVEANVPEADIAKISINDPVVIIFDALPSDEFAGRVLVIDPVEEEIGGVVTYQIEVSIEDPDEHVKPGMTGNLDIETNRRENVLFVPQRAVARENNKRYVQILRNGMPEKIEVTVGIRSADGMLEILSGVQEEQEVISFIRER